MNSHLYSSGSEDSEEDLVTDYSAPPPTIMSHPHQPPMSLYPPHTGSGCPLVPIISVTPHSPAGKQQYPVLEDNLQHLQDIHNSIQHMRNITAQSLSQQIQNLSEQYARLCSSCPSLSEQGSDPDILSSLNSSPTHLQHGTLNTPDMLLKRGSADWQSKVLDSTDLMRRRSWAALDGLDAEEGTRNVLRVERNRSVSLSSMESDMDYLLCDSTANLLGDTSGVTLMRKLSAGSTLVSPRRTTRLGGNSSTHSLNEADLQSDFNKVIAKREAESRLLSTIKLPLQKSISTPSILGPRDLINNGEVSVADSTTIQIMPVDEHQEKGKKRGSIFFRKKKDKAKKLSHQWVSAHYGTALTCDSCSKPLSNKPALHCENCAVTVHQTSCKENIPLCSKIKAANKAAAAKLNNKKSSSCIISQGQLSSSKRITRTISCISPWRRVATKLGVNQILEDKDGDHHHHHHDHYNYSDDTPLVPFEFLDESPITAQDLDTDPALGLQEDDADSWMPTVSKEVSKKLKEKEIKRQEHIYEFILTEKHHCLTLRVMQKVFVDGIQKHFHLAGPSIDRMFPRLKDLTEIHLNFLGALKRRQRQNPVVDSIADILLDQFSGGEAARLKTAYGEFCSRHRDAVNFYKEYFSSDARFAEFVKHCQLNPLLKKKGIPECILFVTQRLTKYPLLIEPLIKTSKENKIEQEKLHRAQLLIKDILIEVNAQVAEKEKEDRKLEMYNRIEAKSSTEYRGAKFKKSDILNFNRKLRFEGLASLMQGRGKSQEVLVIVLSDILFFLQEVSQHKYSLQESSNTVKYTFFTPDNKTGVISLQKLLVREKAGADTRGIYLISSNPAEPEMFELKIVKPKEKLAWIEAIRSAVQNCPEDIEDNSGSGALSVEDKQKLLEAKQAHIRQIVDASLGFEAVLRQKDVEQALILEEKMSLQLKLLAAAGVPNVPSPPSYTHLVAGPQESSTTWQHVMTTVKKVNQLASSLYASGSNLSRSVSSVGEHQSNTYISPTLPKRAETFGGFDTAQPPLKGVHKKGSISSISGGGSGKDPSPSWGDSTTSTPDDSSPPLIQPPAHTRSRLSLQDTLPLPPPSLPPPSLFTLGQEQQVIAMELSHHVYTLSCIIAQQMTSIDSLQAQLSAYRSQVSSGEDLLSGSKDKRSAPYRHNHQLEELRNLQDRLQHEKEAWAKEKETEEKDLEERKGQLLKIQEQVKSEQRDIAEQREKMFRKLELLTSQGILISPNMPLLTPVSPTAPSLDTVASPTSPPSLPSPPDVQRRKHLPPAGGGGAGVGVGTTSASTSPQLPLQLVSATNQQKKVVGGVQQQIPYKLATKLGGLGGGGGSGSQQSSPLSPTSSGVQQMLPYKLSSSSVSAADRHKVSPSGPSGAYMRLTSTQGTEHGHQAPSVSSGPSHARTGSSPAMMQTIEVIEKSGAKAGRTNTYPKLPEKFRVSKTSSSGHSSHQSSNQGTEEEVIFF
uniref:Rho guanine nucleotide exchange factor 18 n=1 Tax=Cacopsylla melanoneura TaxID=428564 RepID=A0A8D8V0I7_9HEMI